ncbi:Protein kinase domain-containing protein [Plasmodiophora brassicae]|nr:hypothetical protein PBRA_005034 [Plasmodiophora brassicae]
MSSSKELHDETPADQPSAVLDRGRPQGEGCPDRELHQSAAPLATGRPDRSSLPESGLQAAVLPQSTAAVQDDRHDDGDPFVAQPALQYIARHPVGSGSYGTVWKGVRKHRTAGTLGFAKLVQDDVAIKFQSHSNASNREASIMAYLRDQNDIHPNVVKVLDVLIGAEGPAIVMESLDGGCLTDRLEQSTGMAESAARSIWLPVLSGLAFLHRHHIYHGDLNPNNIVFNAYGTPKVVDFGLSTHSPCGLVSGPCTVPYEAPEAGFDVPLYKGDNADIWSAGAMLFYMVFGEHAFPPVKHYDAWKELVRTMALRFPCHRRHVSNDLTTLLTTLLALDPSARPALVSIFRSTWARCT